MEELRNPERQSVILALIVSVIGFIIFVVPFIIRAVEVYQFFFAYFGIIIFGGGLVYAFFYYRRYKQYTVFLENKDDALIWEYDDEQYTAFIDELSKIQRADSKKRVLILLGIELFVCKCLSVS